MIKNVKNSRSVLNKIRKKKILHAKRKAELIEAFKIRLSSIEIVD